MAAWDISTLVYSDKYLDLGAGQNFEAMFIKRDGTRVYVLDWTSCICYSYTLSTAWDISTGTSDGLSFDFSSKSAKMSGIFFKSDGAKCYLCNANSKNVYQYTLSTPWNISTAAYEAVYAPAADLVPEGMTFSADGTKMYIGDYSYDQIYQYTLSTAWDITSSTYTTLFKPNASGANPYGLWLKPDGTKLYISSNWAFTGNFQHSLGTAYAVNTATYDNKSLNSDTQDTYPLDISFNEDGKICYILGYPTGHIFQYELPTSINQKINVSDSWKEITAAKINIGDSWKTIASAKINRGDSWKTIF